MFYILVISLALEEALAAYVMVFFFARIPEFKLLTLKVLVATIDSQWEGMGDVGLARYEPTLLPPCPTIRVFKLQ